PLALRKFTRFRQKSGTPDKLLRSLRLSRGPLPPYPRGGPALRQSAARSSGCALEALDVVAASTEGVLPLPSLRKAAMASRSLRRCPNDVTPSSFRSSAVRVSRTVSSMSFSRGIASYFPRPRLRSQTTTSMMARPIQGCCTSSFRLGGVPGGSKRSRIGGFGVNRCRCQKQCHTWWRRIRCQISVCKTDWKLCHVIPLAPPDWQCRHLGRPTLPDREPGPTASNASSFPLLALPTTYSAGSPALGPC